MTTRFLLLVVIACGCRHDRASSSPAKPSRIENAAAPARTPEAEDPLAFLPADADIVVSADLERLRNTPAWRADLAPLLGSLLVASKDIATKCGFDPLQQMTRVTSATKELGDGKKRVTILLRGIDASQYECMAGASWASAKSHRDGPVLLISVAGTGEVIAVTRAGERAVLIEIGSSTTRATVGARLRSGVALRERADFMASFNRLPTSASVWMILNPENHEMFGPRTPPDVRPTGIEFSLTVDERFTLLATVTTATAKGRIEMRKIADMFAAKLKTAAEKVEVREEQDLLMLEARMNVQQLRDVGQTLLFALGLF